MKSVNIESPARIATQQGPLADLLRAAVEHGPHIEQAPAFERLLERAGRSEVMARDETRSNH